MRRLLFIVSGRVFPVALTTVMLISTLLLPGAARAQSGVQCASAERSAVAELTAEITSKENVTVPQDQLMAVTQAIKPLISQRLNLIKQGDQACAAPCKSDAVEQNSFQKDIDALTKRISQAERQGDDLTSLYSQKSDDQKLVYAWARQRTLDCTLLEASLNGSGNIRPAYLPLFVIYAPPGANGGNGTSTASYGSGASFETNLSTSNSFTDDVKFSITFTGGAFGDDASLMLTGDHSLTASDTSTADVKETVADTINVLGPSADGIDHDYDRIYVLLNPNVVLATTNVGTTWSLGHTGDVAKVQYATVGQLKGTQTMPAGVKSDFDQAGLTASEYPKLLGIDPFSHGVTSIDTNRFLLLPTSIPYDPPATASAKPGSVNHVVTDSEQNTQKTEVDTSNSLTITVAASVGSPFAQLKMSAAFEFTYKYTNALSQTSGTSQSIAFTIGQPAYGYSGPADIYVYKDSIFGTYVFALNQPPDRSLLAYGTVRNGSGVALKNIPVSLALNGVVYRTVSNQVGVYRINGKKPARAASGTLSVGTKATIVRVSETSLLKRDLRL